MKLNAFKFIIRNAFYSKDNGLYGILEVSTSSKKINFVIDGKTYFLKILDEIEFINDLIDIGILNWNRKSYEQYYEDGYSWSLMFSYDDTYLETNGRNAYPIEFDAFMDLLHTKYNLPYLNMEFSRREKRFKWHKKGNTVINF